MSNSPANPQQKSFLLLQGVASPFFNQLEKALLKANQKCLKVNFSGGSLLAGEFFSKAQNHINYQGSLELLPAFYNEIFAKHHITDIALFGDTRPIHIPAISLAKQNNINIHVFEEGYFRPNWVTLDVGGVNAYSSVYLTSQNKAQWFLENQTDPNWQEQSDDTGGGLLIRAWHDIRYHLTSFILKKKFPHYKSHRPDSALAEYWGFIRRIPMVHFYYEKRSEQAIQKLLTSKMPYYLLPMQLEADSQMRLHSPFRSLSQVIETTLKSFSKFAPKNSKLVIKLHPLDPWFINYQKIIKDLLVTLKIESDRVLYLEAGNLNQLLADCQGTVLVNSTVGTSALQANCPVIALGKAIYNIEGLTFQGSLDEFWQNANPPDKALFAAFRQCYITRTQINGSFYNQKGISMAVSASIKKLLNTDTFE